MITCNGEPIEIGTHSIWTTAILASTIRRRATAACVAIALVAMLALPVTSVHAAPGDPDLSFGAGLVVTRLFQGATSQPLAVAMDGGLIVSAGYCSNTALTSKDVFCVARYLPDGQLDSSFGDAGKVATLMGDNAAHDSRITAIVVQSDRKIVAVGKCTSNAGVSSFCIARYSANGALDGGFGSGGRIVTSFGGAVVAANAAAMALQSDGGILAAGTCNATDASAARYRDFCLARYDGSGALDATFGSGGKVIASVSPARRDGLGALMVQQDGRLLAAGECDLQFCAVRFNANGAVDASFGTSGKLFISMGGASNAATSLAQQADGKLVMGGRCLNDNKQQFCLARLALASGALDPSFGSGGTVTAALGGPTVDSIGSNVLIQADQKILMSGACTYATPIETLRLPAFCAIRLLGDGQRDLTYGRGGVANIFRRGVSVKLALLGGAVLQADGKLIQSGSCDVGDSYQFCLTRSTTDGALDASLAGGGSGSRSTAVLTGGEAWSLAVQPDGKYVQGGFCSSGSNNDFCLVRYLASGALDLGFGIGGLVRTPMGSDEDGGTVVLIQRDQKIILAGQCVVSAGNNDFCLARYLPNGALDPSFGAGGKVIAAIGTGNDGVNAGLIQFDGKIVLAGYCINAGGNYDFCVARFMPDGALDTGFNGTGKVLTNPSLSVEYGIALAQQADGKLVVSGTCFTGSSFDMCVARYLENGSLDSRFGTSTNAPGPGFVSYGISSSDDIPRNMALQPDGKIVMVGDCRDADSQSKFCILRLLENGTLDLPFGNNGAVLSSMLGIAYSVVAQPDGKLLLGGSCNLDGVSASCIARFNSNGSPDTTFAAAGLRLNPLSAMDTMFSMLLLPDGRVLQGGTCTNSGVKDFCIARYQGGPFNYRYCSHDIDGDGVVTPTIDALIAVRVMRGTTGSAVIGGISFAPQARRTTWGDNTDRDIRRYLRDQCGMTVN